MFDTPLFRALAVVFGCLASACVYLLFPALNYWAVSAVAIIAVILAITYRLDYLHPAVVFCVPWLGVLFFSAIPISSLHQSLDQQTYLLILGAIFAWLLGVSPAKNRKFEGVGSTNLELNSGTLLALFGVCYGCFIVEVLAAGYIPIISLVLSGDSGYGDFGFPTIHGAILAYANALGLTALYCYFRCGRRYLHLFLYLSIVAMLIAEVTRQSTLTLLVETVVVRCFAVKPVRTSTIAYGVLALLLAFSAVGEIRSGDIIDIVKVAPEYEHIPKAAVWAYAYSYFNAMNLQNMILNSGAPFFDGSMFNSLLPSFLRPAGDQESFIVYANLTVTSYLDPVYRDVGFVGSLIITFIIGRWTAITYNKASTDRSLAPIGAYACLFFCALMSFFINFWFYLPVIFQIPFFYLFQGALFGRKVNVMLNVPIAKTS